MRFTRRKLLTASAGLATLTFTSGCRDRLPPANLVVPMPIPGCTESWARMPMRISFARGSAEVDEENRVVLVEFVRSGQTRSDILRVRLDGHSEPCGDELDNMALSQLRADAVGQELYVMGVPREMIEAIGHGSAEPFTDDACDSPSAPSRRVEISLLLCR